VSIRPIFAWYDLWVGVFIDRPKRRLYIFPLPCLGLVITWRTNNASPTAPSEAQRVSAYEIAGFATLTVLWLALVAAAVLLVAVIVRAERNL